MRAVSITDYNEFEVIDVEPPDLDADSVRIDVSRVQLSVTECTLYRGAEVAHAETIRNRIDTGDGRIFGHEFCGTVLEVGSNVDSISIGDRVYAPGKISCGDCVSCR